MAEARVAEARVALMMATVMTTTRHRNSREYEKLRLYNIDRNNTVNFFCFVLFTDIRRALRCMMKHDSCVPWTGDASTWTCLREA
jgi:hypothetical protein